MLGLGFFSELKVTTTENIIRLSQLCRFPHNDFLRAGKGNQSLTQVIIKFNSAHEFEKSEVRSAEVISCMEGKR